MANQDYRSGEYLQITVEAEEPGGYTVSVNGDDRRAFLPTSVSCRPGETLSAQFICMKEERILVSAKFSDHAKRAERRTKHTADFAKRAAKTEQESKA